MLSRKPHLSAQVEPFSPKAFTAAVFQGALLHGGNGGIVASPEVQEFTENRGVLSSLMQRVTKTGVIYATSRAKEHGFSHGDPEWGNLGQGAPETGNIANQPERNLVVPLNEITNEYASVNGDERLRSAVAEYYNHWYRANKDSKYTSENVAIVPGGRAGLARLMASLSNCNVGHFLPEYTAYSQLLGMFGGISPMPVAHDRGQTTSPEKLRWWVQHLGLGAFMLSNPSNPTGCITSEEDLRGYVSIAREEGCLFAFDEFYSHYQYSDIHCNLDSEGRSLHAASSAKYVEDVNSDPVMIINGLTKCWRLPGWRVCWIVGPKHTIDILASVGSYMDGGAPHPLQVAALPLLEPSFVAADAAALRSHFREKRDFLIVGLKELGIDATTPDATFYIWADLRALPPPINSGVHFFEACLEEKVIVVPGIFFDINPHHRRHFSKSPLISFVRMSFGPSVTNLQCALESIKRVITRATQGIVAPCFTPACRPSDTTPMAPNTG